MENKYPTTGIMRYAGSDKAYLEIDPQIAAFYRSLIPKWIDYNVPMYPPHITVVRTGKEVPKNIQVWGKYEGKEIPFEYENTVGYDGTYYYLRVFSPEIERIRMELGLPRMRPQFNDFHITIANSKKLQQ